MVCSMCNIYCIYLVNEINTAKSHLSFLCHDCTSDKDILCISEHTWAPTN